MSDGTSGWYGVRCAFRWATADGGLDGDDEERIHGLDARADGLEVFSMIRESTLGPDDYLTAFFDTGRENNAPREGPA